MNDSSSSSQAIGSTGHLIETAKRLMADDKGLLAMDESVATCNRRFAKLGIAQSLDMRRAYRELIVTTPRLSDSVSGVILFDETIHQHTQDGTPFINVLMDAGIIPGIKVDAGAVDMAGHPGEKVTEGLDGLRERLEAYALMGARFAKWRAVFSIDVDAIQTRVIDRVTPSKACIEANAHALARYAALCQEAGLVPIVEPEVMMNGSHTLQQCAQVTEAVLQAVFQHLNEQGVLLEGLLLKPSMVLPGLCCAIQESVETVADMTVHCLLRTVPAAVPGIAFLSGGQTPELASARLNAMNSRYRSRLPWALTFSFSRAIELPALEVWLGQDDNIEAAQKVLLQGAANDKAARRGEYSVAAN
ncbi:fructose-bisphosphate aldolase class I [Marinomonas sp. UCMA 3892]|uniref:class I fructose-bisphosphate aldolase n=1 Tax=unclassified Marinomonas TaxID=196814 RepID=UPI00146ABE6E|nr:class I fructose-bisphosphate aldolase [Marinomonas sp. UCMA 3892]NLU99742.1 fructose-bisphosphate aldolase class I [Marinomonas sp. UCMA 3892]